jgi:hypothetical protein
VHSGEYDPRKYFKDGQLFHGLNENKKPVYTDLIASLDGHICITGGSGAGKGVLTRNYLSQFISYGLTNVVLMLSQTNIFSIYVQKNVEEQIEKCMLLI